MIIDHPNTIVAQKIATLAKISRGKLYPEAPKEGRNVTRRRSLCPISLIEPQDQKRKAKVLV